jgi:hypothetical protein
LKILTLLAALCMFPLASHAAPVDSAIPTDAQSPIDLTPAHWLPTGVYGGAQAALTVDAHSAHLDLPCAIGSIPHRPVLDSHGYFRVAGTYGSRMLTRPPRPQFPAIFTGHLVGTQLWIQVEVQSRENIQRYSYGPLTFGQQGRFFRCL